MADAAPDTHVRRSLILYHTSDVHSRLGFGARLSALVEPDALLVDAGDSLRGSSTIYRKREPVTQEFTRAPYRAQAVGNREFHYLHRCMLARARSMPMPWICSNLLDLRARQPAFARDLTLNAAGISVRFLGAMPPQYRTGSGWERLFGWRFLDPARAIAELLASSPSAADAIVLLSHLGLKKDREIAQNFPQLAAIIGGHSHDTLSQPEIAGGVPIVHAGPYAQYAGRLQLMLGAGRPRVASFRLVPLLAPQATP
jgi:2',3'-cyclic-nucleotide 2'-phosphodiesterase (5'-nucleotidase family)